MFGNLDATYGIVRHAPAAPPVWASATRKLGNFLAVDGVAQRPLPRYSGVHCRFTTRATHKHSSTASITSRTGQRCFHLNLFAARNWIQIPNAYDQLAQDQRQRVLTWSFAPGYQHTFNAHTLLTVNPYIRKDQFHYYGSRDPFADTPSTQDQARQLLNWGVKSDLAITSGRHDLKIGIDLKQTRLAENFGFGITDFNFNPVCLDVNGGAAGPIRSY